MPFWSFLQGRFGTMPKWVQVSTFLILLAVTVYLYLAPRFVSGQIVAQTGNGGYVPYRGVPIQTHVDGRMLKFTTNEAGYWTIPIVDRKPGGVKLMVYHEDDLSWFPVTINAAQVWTDDFRIVVSEEAPFVALETAALSPALQVVTRYIASVWGLFRPSTAYAGSLEYGKKTANGAASSNRPTPSSSDRTGASLSSEEREVRAAVRKVVAKVTKTPVRRVTLATRLSRANGVGYVKRIRIIEDLERIYAIKIPDQHWRKLSTVGQLVDYILDRKTLERVRSGPKDLWKSPDWAKIQQSFPEKEKPKFSY